ncbi:MAG: hypothetical protein Fur0019_08450 [Tibeticola sp.]
MPARSAATWSGVKSFADLTKPALEGKVAIASPLVSGSTHVIDGALWKDPRFGWKYFEQLKKNDLLVLNDVPDVARAVASGERALVADQRLMRAV